MIVAPHRRPRDRARGLRPPRDGRLRGRRAPARSGWRWRRRRQSYAALLPGIVASACGLAMSTAPDHGDRDPRRAARPAWASPRRCPNISRYTGGALGAALLGAILHAHLTAGLDRSLGQVAPVGPRPGGRGLPHRPAGGGRVPPGRGAAAASRMPRLGAHEPAVAAAAVRSTPRWPGERPSAIGVFLAPVRDTPDHIALAEELGFASAWCYDSPLLYHDPFATLARAADRTSRIGLGVGVVVPGLRTPAATVGGAAHPRGPRAGAGAGRGGGRLHGPLHPGARARAPGAPRARGRRPARACSPARSARTPRAGARSRDMPVPGAEGAGDGAALRLVPRRARPGAGAPAGRRGHDRDLLPGRPRRCCGGAIGPDLPLAVHAVGAVADEGEPLDSPRLRAAVGPVVAVAFHAFAEQPWRLEGLDPALRVAGRGLRRRRVERPTRRAAPPDPPPRPPGRARRSRRTRRS